MGGLFSSPSVPTSHPVQTISYVPAPAASTVSSTPTTTVDTSVDTTSDTSADSAATAEENASEARTQSLIDRDRSRAGTIQTSFRGLLGLSNNGASGQKKTLLGE